MPPANDENAGAEPLVTASSAPAVPPSPPPVDEGPSPFVQEGVPRKHLHAASVTFLDGTKHVFYVHRNADADILYTLVTDFLQLNEKDYFGLAFYDEQTIRQWLYKDKKIVKTLKGRPWEFTFEVKFYPPEPSQLADDLTKYLLHLQLKNDIVTEKLPATFATHALLGSYIAQAEFGDYVPNLESYDAFLRNARIAPIVTSDLMDKVRELHRQNKGQTAQEAELNYLNTCKKLSMYGVTLFEAKDNKGKSVHIGVSAHGVSVYNDQIRIHRFVWQSIIKIAYRRNVFSIRLKAGEIEKKEATVSYKLADYPSAKRLWKCAVEHHTFFRLMQPEDKPKKHLLRWGSARFRYLGRTHFQTTMASQMFDSATASERPQSARAVSRSADDIAAKVHKEPTSPLHYVDENSKELVSSPEKTYDVSASGSPKKKKSKQKQQSVVAAAAVEVGGAFPADPNATAAVAITTITTTSATAAHYSSSSSQSTSRWHGSTSSTSTRAAEYYVATPTTSHGGNPSSLLASSSPSDVATTSDGASPSSVYSPQAVDVVSPVTNESSSSSAGNGRTSTSSGSQRVRFRDQTAHAASRARRNLFGRLGRKEGNSPYLAPLPIIRNGQDKRPTSAQGVVHHNGSLHDADDTREQRRKRHKRLSDWLGVTKRYPTPVSALLAEDQKLSLSDEVEMYPIRYYSAIYHSGQSTPYSSVFESSAESEVEDGAPNLAANYAFAKTEIFEHGRMEKATELDTEPLLVHCKRTLLAGQLQAGSKRKRWDSEDNISQPSSKRVAVLYVKQRPEESNEKATRPLCEGYPALTDAYDGRVSELQLAEEIDEETLPTYLSKRADAAMEAIEVERNARANKAAKTRILRFTSKTTISENAAMVPEKLHGYPSLSEPYRGTYPVETLAEQIAEAPLRSVVSVYHSGFTTRHYKVITEIHVGHEECSTEPSVSYTIVAEPHEGPVEALEPVEELRVSSIRQHCLVTRVPQVELKSSEKSTRRTDHDELRKHTAKLTLRSPTREEAQTAVRQSEAVGKPVTHTGPEKAVNKRAVLWASKRAAISKESDSDALHEPNLASYRKDSLPYEGDVERLVTANELEAVPLKHHVSIYHQGLSVEKPKGYQKVLATLHIRRSSAGRDFLPSFKNVGEKSPKISPAGKEPRKTSRRSTSSPKTSVSAAESQNIRQLKRISNFEKKVYITTKTESAQEQALSVRDDQKKPDAIGSQTSTSYSHVEIHRRAIKNFITHEAKPMVTASEVQKSEEPLQKGTEQPHTPTESDRIRQTAVLHIKSEPREEPAKEASPVEQAEKRQVHMSIKEEDVAQAASGVDETKYEVPTPPPSRLDTYLRVLRISTKSPSPAAETKQASPIPEPVPAYLISHWPQKTEPFSGYVDSLNHKNELSQEPLRSQVRVYHSGRPAITVYRTYTYKAVDASPSEERIVTHPSSEAYEGDMDALSYKPGLSTEPLKQYVPHYRRASTKRWTQRVRRPMLETRRAVERRVVSRRAPRRLSRQANLEVHVKDSGPPSKRKSKAVIYLRVRDEPEVSTEELGQKEEVPGPLPQEALKQELIDSHESAGPEVAKSEGTAQRIATFLRIKRKPVESKKADVSTERTDESAQLSKKTAIIHVKSEPQEPKIEMQSEKPAEAEEAAERTKTTAIIHVKSETQPEAETTDQCEATIPVQPDNAEAVEVQRLQITQELEEAPLGQVDVKQEITEEPEQRETPVRTAVIQVKQGSGSPPPAEEHEPVYDAQIEVKHELIEEEYRQETTTTKLTLTEVKSTESITEPDVEPSSTSKITAVVHTQKKGKKRKGKSKGKQTAVEKHPVEPEPAAVTTEILARTTEVETEPICHLAADDIKPEALAFSEEQWEVPETVNDYAQPPVEWSATPDWDSHREEGSPKKTAILHVRKHDAPPPAEKPTPKPKGTKPAPKQRYPFDAETYAGPMENVERVPEVELIKFVTTHKWLADDTVKASAVLVEDSWEIPKEQERVDAPGEWDATPDWTDPTPEVRKEGAKSTARLLVRNRVSEKEAKKEGASNTSEKHARMLLLAVERYPHATLPYDGALNSLSTSSEMERVPFESWRPQQESAKPVLFDEGWQTPEESAQPAPPVEWDNAPYWEPARHEETTEPASKAKLVARLHLRTVESVAVQRQESMQKMKRQSTERTAHYPVTSEPHNGPLDAMSPTPELEPMEPVRETILLQATVSGEGWQTPEEPAQPAHPTEWDHAPEWDSAGQEATEPSSKAKLVAHLHLKTVESVPTQESVQKTKRQSTERTVHYPVITEPHTGPVDAISPTLELEPVEAVRETIILQATVSAEGWQTPEESAQTTQLTAWNQAPEWDASRHEDLTEPVFNVKRVAHLHLKTAKSMPEEAKEPVLTAKRKTTRRTTQYPVITEPHTGPIDSISPTPDFEPTEPVWATTPLQPATAVVLDDEWAQPQTTDEQAPPDVHPDWNEVPQWTVEEVANEPSYKDRLIARLHLRERKVKQPDERLKQKGKVVVPRYPVDEEPFQGPVPELRSLPEMEEAAFSCWPARSEDFKREGIVLDETHWAMPQHTVDSELQALPPAWHETPEWNAEAEAVTKATARLYLRQEHAVSEEEKKPAKAKRRGGVENYPFVTDSYTGPLEITELTSEIHPSQLLSRPALAQDSSDEWAHPVAPATKWSEAQAEAVAKEMQKSKLRAHLHLRQTTAVPEPTKASKRKPLERTAQYPVLTDPYVGTLEVMVPATELEPLSLLSRPHYIAGDLSEWVVTTRSEQADTTDLPPEWSSAPAWNETKETAVAEVEVPMKEMPKNKLLARLHIRRTEEVSEPATKTKRKSLARAAHYAFVTDVYVGPVEATALTTEIEPVPLISQPRENTIDSKEWSQPPESDEAATKELPAEWNASPQWDEAHEVKVSEEPEPAKTTAHLYLRQEREAEVAEPEIKRKLKDATLEYPFTDPYEGPLAVIAPLSEFEPSTLELEPRPSVALDVSQWAVPSEPSETATQEPPPEWNVTPQWNVKEEVPEPEEYRVKTTAVLNLKTEQTAEEVLVKEEIEKQSEYPVIAVPYTGPIDVLAPVIEIETVEMTNWTTRRESLPVDEHWGIPHVISQSPPMEWNKKPEWDVPRDEEAHQDAAGRKCKAVLYLKQREVEPSVEREPKKPKKVNTTPATETTPLKLTARIVVRERHEGEETIEMPQVELYPSASAFEGEPEVLARSADFETSAWVAEQRPSTFSTTLLSRISQSKMVVVRTFTMPKQQSAQLSTPAPPMQKTIDATAPSKTEPYGGPVYFLDYSSELPAEEVILQVKNEPEEADEWATPSSSRWEMAREEPEFKPTLKAKAILHLKPHKTDETEEATLSAKMVKKQQMVKAEAVTPELVTDEPITRESLRLRLKKSRSPDVILTSSTKESVLAQYPVKTEPYDGFLYSVAPSEQLVDTPLPLLCDVPQSRLPPPEIVIRPPTSDTQRAEAVQDRVVTTAVLHVRTGPSNASQADLAQHPQSTCEYSGELGTLVFKRDIDSTEFDESVRRVDVHGPIHPSTSKATTTHESWFESVRSRFVRRSVTHQRSSKRSAHLEEKHTGYSFVCAARRQDDASRVTKTFATDASIFNNSEHPVTDVSMDIMLQKERQVVFECEVFLSAKTRYFSPIFGRKRGPAFLPKSLLEDVAAETELAAREPRGIGERWAREVADVRLSARAKNASKAGTKLKGPDETRVESSEQADPHLHPDIPTSSGSKEAGSLNFNYTPSTSSMDNRTESQKQTEAHGADAAAAEHPSFLTSIKRRLSQHIGKEKKEKKRDKKEKKDKKDKKKKDKKKKKKGKDVSSSSSSSSDASDVEVEERHIEVSAPVHEEERRKLTAHILTTAPIETPLESPEDAEGKENVERSAGPYTPPLEAKHGPVIREEKVEQVYRIVGTGKNAPKIDPKDPSLDKVVASLERNGEAPLTVKMAEKHVVVREKAPVPTEIREASLPHTTVHTWHETSAGPETVTTEVDEHGNTITRTLRSQQVKHTIQKQSYQTYEVDENNPTAIGTVERSHEILTPIGEKASSRSPVLETHTRTVAYENGDDYLNANASDVPGELISSKAVTTGNRTVETLTYKIEKDGVVETRVEHRVTIHGGDDIDHDAELSRAILEATKMNPEMTVETIEVKQETQG